MIKQTMKNLDKLTSMPRVNEFCMLLAGNDHGKWLPFHELHKGEFIRKLKFLNAQRVSMKYLPYPQDVQGILKKAAKMGVGEDIWPLRVSRFTHQLNFA